VRYRQGVWVGWVLQVVLLATGIVLPALYITGAIFVAIWIFCFVRARQFERGSSTHSIPAPQDKQEGQAP
jgi:hypothetical protein